MNDAGFGDVVNAVKVLDGYHLPWAVCGGWAIDLFLDRLTRSHKDVEGDSLLYRRNSAITLPAASMIISCPLGVPILAPEIVLLYKSGKPEDPCAMSDFEMVSPVLSFDSRSWLAAALRKLNPDHVWLQALL